MPVIIPDVGKQNLLAQLMARIAAGGQNAAVHLYQNPYVPVESTVLGDFVESTFDGYAPLPLPAAADQGINPSDIDVWTFDPLQWTAASGVGLPQIQYGYWVDCLLPGGGTQLLWCQAFDEPWGLASAGQTIQFLLSLGSGQL